MEAAVVERLRRSGESSPLHPLLVHAPLIYDPRGRRAIRAIYEEYVGIAEKAGLPLLLVTHTWRANSERVAKSGAAESINEDAVLYLKGLRDELASNPERVRIGGLIGCKNDCYRPQEGLAADEAERFHAWQLDRLAGAGVDFLMASTLPALPEAIGIARAMSRTETPYIVSFVINRQGTILDGTELGTAIGRIDDEVASGPLGYMINCAHPSFFEPGRLSPDALARIVGFQANASSLDHAELDGAGALQADDVSDWALRMLELHRLHGLKIIGGCCGTNRAHLEGVVRGL